MSNGAQEAVSLPSDTIKHVLRRLKIKMCQNCRAATRNFRLASTRNLANLSTAKKKKKKSPEQVKVKKVQRSQKSWVYKQGRGQEASPCAALGWRTVVADAKQPFSHTERARAGLSSHLAVGFGVFPKPEILWSLLPVSCVPIPRQKESTAVNRKDAEFFFRKRLESCSLLPITHHRGTQKARSKGCLVLGLKKGSHIHLIWLRHFR